jgi:hypothetical protein
VVDTNTPWFRNSSASILSVNQISRSIALPQPRKVKLAPAPVTAAGLLFILGIASTLSGNAALYLRSIG